MKLTNSNESFIATWGMPNHFLVLRERFDTTSSLLGPGPGGLRMRLGQTPAVDPPDLNVGLISSFQDSEKAHSEVDFGKRTANLHACELRERDVRERCEGRTFRLRYASG